MGFLDDAISGLGGAFDLSQENFTTTTNTSTAPQSGDQTDILSGIKNFIGTQNQAGSDVLSSLNDKFNSTQSNNLFSSAQSNLSDSLNSSGLTLNQAELDTIGKTFGDSRRKLQQYTDAAVGNFGSDSAGTNLASQIADQVSLRNSEEAKTILGQDAEKKRYAQATQDALAKQQLGASESRLKLAGIKQPGSDIFNTLSDIQRANTSGSTTKPGPTETEQFGTLAAALGALFQGMGGSGGQSGSAAGGIGNILQGIMGGGSSAITGLLSMLGLGGGGGATDQLANAFGGGGSSGNGGGANANPLAGLALPLLKKLIPSLNLGGGATDGLNDMFSGMADSSMTGGELGLSDLYGENWFNQNSIDLMDAADGVGFDTGGFDFGDIGGGDVFNAGDWGLGDFSNAPDGGASFQGFNDGGSGQLFDSFGAEDAFVGDGPGFTGPDVDADFGATGGDLANTGMGAGALIGAIKGGIEDGGTGAFKGGVQGAITGGIGGGIASALGGTAAMGALGASVVGAVPAVVLAGIQAHQAKKSKTEAKQVAEMRKFAAPITSVYQAMTAKSLTGLENSVLIESVGLGDPIGTIPGMAGASMASAGTQFLEKYPLVKTQGMSDMDDVKGNAIRQAGQLAALIRIPGMQETWDSFYSGQMNQEQFKVASQRNINRFKVDNAGLIATKKKEFADYRAVAEAKTSNVDEDQYNEGQLTANQKLSQKRLEGIAAAKVGQAKKAKADAQKKADEARKVAQEQAAQGIAYEQRRAAIAAAEAAERRVAELGRYEASQKITANNANLWDEYDNGQGGGTTRQRSALYTQTLQESMTPNEWQNYNDDLNND